MYFPGELVIARCTGHPWWPGMIRKVTEQNSSSRPFRYDVMFLDDKKMSTATVPEEQIKAYVKNTDPKKLQKVKRSQVKSHSNNKSREGYQVHRNFFAI